MPSDSSSRELDDYLAAHPETRYLETLLADMNGILRGKRAERHDFPSCSGTA
jgi:glutamine synthetase